MPPEEQTSPPDIAQLRRMAEERVRANPPPLPQGDPHRILHELQVHEIQLEMQNEELRHARSQLESLVEKFSDLYDFAPVGYFSLDAAGCIHQANLTGASMLSIERSCLLRRRFQEFVTPAGRSDFSEFLRNVFADEGKSACEVQLGNKQGGTMWVDLQATCCEHTRGAEPLCRLAVSDITARKHAAEAQSRAEALRAVNEALETEVAQRKRAEKSLLESKRRQSRLLVASRIMQEQLRLLSHRVLHVQEVERKCISRDLHDEIAQTLVAINLHLGALARDSSAGTERMQRKIRETQELVQQSVESVHRFAMGLRPTMLDDLGLISSLRAFAKDFTERTNLPVHLEMPDVLKPPVEGGGLALYRVAQSALSNVARHAEATEVRLTLRQTQRSLFMEVADNGKTFQANHTKAGRKGNRLGLVGMRERTEMVGGRLRISSSPGKGTTVSVRLPLANAPAPSKSKTKDSL